MVRHEGCRNFGAYGAAHLRRSPQHRLGGPRIIPQNALEDTGVYGLPDAVLVPSIGVSGGQWVPSGDKSQMLASSFRLPMD